MLEFVGTALVFLCAVWLVFVAIAAIMDALADFFNE